MKRQLDYADPWVTDPFKCVNDGFQFHLSSLVKSGQKGKLGTPYDSKRHSTYRIAGEDADIRQFTIWLTISGSTFQMLEAEVWHLYDKQWESLAKRPNQGIGYGDTFTLTDSLPLPLTVTWVGDCNYYFKYGEPSVDGLRAFQFDTLSAGFGARARTVKSGEPAMSKDMNGLVPYCIQAGTSSSKTTQIIIKCTFPAW